VPVSQGVVTGQWSGMFKEAKDLALKKHWHIMIPVAKSSLLYVRKSCRRPSIWPQYRGECGEGEANHHFSEMRPVSVVHECMSVRRSSPTPDQVSSATPDQVPPRCEIKFLLGCQIKFLLEPRSNFSPMPIRRPTKFLLDTY